MSQLPAFTYFPDPVAAGIIVASDAVCECCSMARGYVSSTGIYAVANVEALCPWCIADGRAADKWNGSFNIPDKRNRDIPEAALTELSCLTPALETWQDWNWPCSETDVMCFVGEVDGAAVLRDGDVKTRDACLTAFRTWGGVHPHEMLSIVKPGGDPAVYLFKDRATGELVAIADGG